MAESKSLTLVEICEYLKVSRETVLNWINKKICLHIRLADYGDLMQARLMSGLSLAELLRIDKKIGEKKMSLSVNIKEKADLIWAIADKLTGVYKPHEYGEVILPLAVIRRFDMILSDTKEAVVDKFKEVKDQGKRINVGLYIKNHSM